MQRYRKKIYRVKHGNEKTRELHRKQSEGFVDVESFDNDLRYKMAIIDILTKYTNMKFVENQLKSQLNNVESDTISATDPDTYQARFYKFLSDRL